MEFSFRELRGVPGLCPQNYSWPGYFKPTLVLRVLFISQLPGWFLGVEYADFRGVWMGSFYDFRKRNVTFGGAAGRAD